MQRKLITILAAALVAVPAASATWFAYGTYEPDTQLDVTGGYMQLDADATAGGKKLYFNVYQTLFLAGTSANSATLGGRVLQAGVQNYNAMLGPWVDCNGDSYVGQVESAMVVYPSAALLTTDVCPVGSDQNDGQWVYEYVPVGYDPRESPQDAHSMQIADEDALVWGDAGLPGAGPAATCPISPFPHGTTSGTGWMIRYLDCFASNRVQNTANGLNEVCAAGQCITFAFTCSDLEQDEVCQGNPQKSDSVLNQHFPESLFGNPETGETGTLQLDSEEDGGSEEAAFTTWDCGGRLIEVEDPTGMGSEGIPVPEDVSADGKESFADDDGNIAWVATPAPAVNDPTDSVADGLNGTFRGVHVGSQNDNQETVYAGGDCNLESDDAGGDNTYAGAHATVFFRADSPFEPPTGGKKETDDYFIYFNGAANSEEFAAIFGPNAPQSIVSTPPTQYTGTFGADPIWQSNTLWATTPQSINRGTLQPQGAIYWTFYGRVGESTTSLGYSTPGSSGVYASEACGSETSGIHNGWDCDSSHWYTDANFQPIVDGNEIWQARAGDSYQFRDIDCFDGSVVRGAGVFASLVLLATDPRPCQDALI